MTLTQQKLYKEAKRRFGKKVQYYGGATGGIMLVFQNPSPPGKGKTIKECRKGMEKWLNKKTNLKFSEKFFKHLEDYYRIGKPILDGKVDGKGAFNNFYITDAFKITAKGERLGRKLKMPEFVKGSLDFLEKEIKNAKPKLIIVFGSRAWEKFSARFFGGQQYEKKITQAHGCVYYYEECPVIPLVFIGQGKNYTLRNSYWEYLEEGLRKSKEQYERAR